MSGEITMAEGRKINGFDKWDIEQAAKTLIEAQKILKDKRPKYLTTVATEVNKQAEAAEQAALIAKTTQRLTNTFVEKK